MDTNNNLVYRDLFYNVMGAVCEVHNVLGAGFLEKVYERALLEELNLRGIKAVAQQEITVLLKGKQVGFYVSDIVVEDQIVIELKAVDALTKVHEAQLLNYFKATGLRLGLLINFSGGRVESKRFAL